MATTMRECDIFAGCDICGRSMKAQMKYANKIGAQYTVVLGDDELANNKAKLKNMDTGETSDISLDEEQFITDFMNRSMADEDTTGLFASVETDAE